MGRPDGLIRRPIHHMLRLSEKDRALRFCHGVQVVYAAGCRALQQKDSTKLCSESRSIRKHVQTCLATRLFHSIHSYVLFCFASFWVPLSIFDRFSWSVPLHPDQLLAGFRLCSRGSQPAPDGSNSLPEPRATDSQGCPPSGLRIAL